MTDSTRKRTKVHQVAPLSELPMLGQSASHVVSEHKRPGHLDLQEFIDGTLNKKTSNKSWLGGFSGRPQLVNDLEPSIREVLVNAPEGTVTNARQALRAWWRLFDVTSDFADVQRLEDINDIHGAEQARAGFDNTYRNTFLRLVNHARDRRHLPRLFFPTGVVTVPEPELPQRRDIAALYHFLKSRVRAVIDRWASADEAARAGTDWCGTVKHRPQTAPWMAGEVHATYRGALSREKRGWIPRVTLLMQLGVEHDPTGFANLSIPTFGLYPGKSDLQAFLFLFLLRTGWNLQVALDLEITGNWRFDHPTSSEHHIVRSVKERGKTEQIAIGLNRSDTSPGALVQALIERTKPLRMELQGELENLDKGLEQGTASPALLLKRAELVTALKSPWIFVDVQNGRGPVVLLGKNATNGSGGAGRLSTWIRRLNAKSVNRAAHSGASPHIIDESLTVGDLRDAYIAFAYERSGFNWLVTMLAAGHSALNSLKSYLRHRQQKARSNDEVRKLTNAFWTEVAAHGIADPALLRALVRRGAITEEQRQRWLDYKDRTRVGTGCRDVLHPPRTIAPHHKAGTSCRVQRCTLCDYGVVFSDSVNHIARRLCELHNINTTIPLASWFESTFPDEVAATERTLLLFEPAVVAERVRYWTLQIASGAHQIPMFEGEYA